ncbi:MAG: hypothetical protein WCO56_22910 [Verrucomicrobiota bacterium]
MKATDQSGTTISISKRTVIVLGLLMLLGVGAGIGWWWINKPPQPVWYVKWQLWRCIKKQSGYSAFQYNYKFTNAPDVGAIQLKVTALESNVVPIQEANHKLYHEYADMEKDLAPVQKELVPLRTRLTGLRAELAAKSNRLANQEKQLAAILSNPPPVLTNYPVATLSDADALTKVVTALKSEVDPLSLPLQPLRDEIAALQAKIVEKNQAMLASRREIKLLTRELNGGKKAGPTTNEVVQLTPEEMTTLTNKINELTKNTMEPLQAEAANLQTQLTAKQQELTDKQKDFQPKLMTLNALINQQVALLGVQTNLAWLRTNVPALQQELTEKQALADAKFGSISNKLQIYDTKRKLYLEKTRALTPQLNELANLRKEMTGKLKDFAAQQNDFNNGFRKKYDEAKTYAQMYTLLGQQLWVADELLEQPDPMRRLGLFIANQTVSYAQDPIENSWLAARICEAYLVPNLDLAEDPNQRPPMTPDALLQQCAKVFRDNDESENLIQVLKLSIKKAGNNARGDQARFLLSREYENQGAYQEALNNLREIRNTNTWSRYLNRHIPYLEGRVKSQR